jgi:hypothetical protein
MTSEFVLEKVRRNKTGSKMQFCFEFSTPEQADAFWSVALPHERESEQTATQGAEYRVIIRKPKRRRSTGKHSQNSHFHGHVQEIAQATGNDFDDVKLYLKRRAIRQGYPIMMDDKGEVTCSLVDGDPLPAHERDASSEEAALLIDEAHILAAELGIVLTEEG